MKGAFVRTFWDMQTSDCRSSILTVTVVDSAVGLTVESEALAVTIGANPTLGTAPLGVTFGATPSGGAPRYTYSWDLMITVERTG